MMWATDLGIVVRTRDGTRQSEALAAYVRTEFGEADVAWYLAEARRAATKPKERRLSRGNSLRRHPTRATGSAVDV